MTRTLTCCIALFVSTLTLTASAEEVPQPPLTLQVGHSRVLDIPKLERIALGNPQVADVKPVGVDQLLVVGLKEGKTELQVWRKKSRLSWVVTVTAAEAPPPPGPAPEVVQLKVGAKVTRAAPNLQRVAIGDPGVVDVTASDAGLELRGLTPGSTTLVTWQADGSRVVVELRVTP